MFFIIYFYSEVNNVKDLKFKVAISYKIVIGIIFSIIFLDLPLPLLHSSLPLSSSRSPASTLNNEPKNIYIQIN